jgi:hypothetical protein
MILARENVPGADPAQRPVMSNPTQSSIRAPNFPENLDWLNTGGERLSLEKLRGKIVLLDFWTYG